MWGRSFGSEKKFKANIFSFSVWSVKKILVLKNLDRCGKKVLSVEFVTPFSKICWCQRTHNPLCALRTGEWPEKHFNGAFKLSKLPFDIPNSIIFVLKMQVCTLKVRSQYTIRSRTNRLLASVWYKISTFQMIVVSKIGLPLPWDLRASIPLLRAFKWGSVCRTQCCIHNIGIGSLRV